MIPVIVFYLHVVGFVAAFTKRWQEENVGEGFIIVFFMALIFFVGWAMTSFILRIFLEPEGIGLLLDRDSASLLLLTAAEAVLYYFYFREEHPSGENNPQSSEK